MIIVIEIVYLCINRIMESVKEKMKDVIILEATIEEKKVVNRLEDFLEWENSCALLIEKLGELIANKYRDLKVGTINSLICKRVKLEGNIEQLRRQFTYEGRGLKRKRSDSYEFVWQEIETAFNNHLVTGAVLNINYIYPQRFLIEAEETVLKHVKKVLQIHNIIKVYTVFNGEFIVKDKKTVKGFNTKNNELFITSDLQKWYMEHVVDSTMTQLQEFQERDSGWALYRILNLMININKL